MQSKIGGGSHATGDQLGYESSVWATEGYDEAGRGRISLVGVEGDKGECCDSGTALRRGDGMNANNPTLPRDLA